MKWNNRGHEFDSQIEIFQTRKGVIFIDDKNIFIELQKKISIFASDIRFNPSKDYKNEDCSIDSAQIITFDQVISLLASKRYIAIICNLEAYSDYSGELANAGLMKNVDYYEAFYFREYYLSIWVYATTGKIYANVIGHPQNWKCTLKCKECSVCIPYLSKRNPTLSVYLAQMDALFNKIDFIYTYDLTGGETFIPSDLLADIIVYLIRNYGNRIGEILITTNATLIPSEKLLKILQACSDFIRINVSQYREVPGWKEKYDRFCEILTAYSIPLYAVNCSSWISLWNRDASERVSHELALGKFDSCSKFCKLYADYRLYHCVQGYGANEAFYHTDMEQESKDLRDDALSGIEILEFLAGYSEKGYMEVCSYCKGLYGTNTHFVPIAEQLP